jgi:predicted ATPase
VTVNTISLNAHGLRHAPIPSGNHTVSYLPHTHLTTDIEGVPVPDEAPRRRRIVTRPTTDLEFRVGGYKALRDMVSIPIRPLTLIAGANSSGKSSFMQAILLLKQTIEAQFDPGPLLLDGPNVAITSTSQMFSRGKSRQDVSKNVRIGMSTRRMSVDLSFTRGSKGLKLDTMEVEQGGKRIRVHENTKEDRDFIDSIPGIRKEMYRRLLNSQEEEVSVLARRNRCFFDIVLKVGEFPGTGIPYDPVNSFRRVALETIHVPGLRGNPERVYPSSAVGTAFPGRFEKYVASLLHDWQTSKGEKRLRLKSLNQDLEDLGLTWKIMAKPINDTSVELLVGRLPHAQQGGALDVVNIADVGFGVSQTLPVLAALTVARQGQIVYLEQPEIHLHPKAQATLAKILVRHARRGVIVVAETHSSLLIKAIQTSLALGEIRAEDVALHWFGRSAESGVTSVKTADLDDLGRFGDWPIDFDDIAMEAEMEYLNAVEERLDTSDEI